ncbi:MAG: protein TonB [Halieaceae bacterium]|jgi:protein TonB
MLASVTAAYSDKLGFTLILATLIHATIILGVRFGAENREYEAPQLEVTLAQYRSDNAPEKTDYLAQLDQLGSGTVSDRAEMTTTEQAVFKTNEIQQVEQITSPRVPQSEATQTVAVSTSSPATDATAEEQKELDPRPVQPREELPDITKRSQFIASLEAKLDAQNKALAKLPRVHRISSLSTRRAVDASYVHHWRQKVEAVGNRNYPEQSRRNGIYGDLRLLVAIRRDGSLKAIEVLSSSGHKVLDEAAVRIVRLAAPYPPFPPELRATTDVLEIIRTWQFKQNRLSSM